MERVLVMALVALFGLSSTGCIAHVCYKGSSKGFKKITGVTLNDGLNDGTYELTKLSNVCNPAIFDYPLIDPNSVDPNSIPNAIIDDFFDVHFAWYELKRKQGTQNTALIPVLTIFGEFLVEVQEDSHLLVPSAKAIGSDPNALDDNVPFDHYHCYGAEAEPEVENLELYGLTDQFTTPADVEVDPVEHLCLPVSKNGEPVHIPEFALLCMDIDGPKHKKVKNIKLLDQFGPHPFETSSRNEICFPAQRLDLCSSNISSLGGTCDPT
jgi:hypothetical protein